MTSHTYTRRHILPRLPERICSAEAPGCSPGSISEVSCLRQDCARRIHPRIDLAQNGLDGVRGVFPRPGLPPLLACPGGHLPEPAKTALVCKSTGSRSLAWTGAVSLCPGYQKSASDTRQRCRGHASVRSTGTTDTWTVCCSSKSISPHEQATRC